MSCFMAYKSLYIGHALILWLGTGLLDFKIWSNMVIEKVWFSQIFLSEVDWESPTFHNALVLSKSNLSNVSGWHSQERGLVAIRLYFVGTEMVHLFLSIETIHFQVVEMDVDIWKCPSGRNAQVSIKVRWRLHKHSTLKYFGSTLMQQVIVCWKLLLCIFINILHVQIQQNYQFNISITRFKKCDIFRILIKIKMTLPFMAVFLKREAYYCFLRKHNSMIFSRFLQ